MILAELPGLNIDAPTTTPDAPNFKPNRWPPPADFPVVIDENQNVVSRYGDVRWDLTPWAGTTLTMFFGDGPGLGSRVSPENAALLRQVVAWWLWGVSRMRSPRALVAKFETLKPLFVACTNNNILASDLYRFPRVIKALPNFYGSKGERLINYLTELNYAKDVLGFTILDAKGLVLLSQCLPDREEAQTAYIPTRIWSYQVTRLRECIDDYISNKENLEACYKFCLDAVAANAGGNLADAFGGLGVNTPFNGARPKGARACGKVYYGSFRETAERYKVDWLLDKWCNTENKFTPGTLSSFFNLVSIAGLAYTLNFTLMRIDEGAKLRADCYEVERDEFGDDIHLIKGVTTKTVQDGNARWIVSPTVQPVIAAMIQIAHLRLIPALANPYTQLSDEDISNPLLQSFTFEPWSSNRSIKNSTKKYKKQRTYADIWHTWPKLFDANAMTITEADFELANRMTFGLDPEKFAIGKVWPIAWHQLRRTGAVNMLASGLVTEASLQYQLKHASRAMSQYYGKNFYRLKEPLNDEAKGYYLREMYQTMVREFTDLQSDQYLSPHGQKRKEQLLEEISEKDHQQLISAAKSGRISYRQTFLGGCAKSGPPCPLGGISNISACMGFGGSSPCASALLDKAKLPLIQQLKATINLQLQGAEVDSPLHESLQAQLESAERAIHVIESN